MKVNSIQVKIVSIIIFVLLITIGFSVFLTIKNQKNDLLQATQKTLSINTAMLNEVIDGIMLEGEAPTAVLTMENLKKIKEFEEISIYRTNGTAAFTDFTTINLVNEYLKDIIFSETQRIPNKSISNDYFNQVIKTEKPLQIELEKTREMEYYFPLENAEACWSCHPQSSGTLRGVAYFKISISDIYNQINKAGKNLIIFYSIIGILIAVILIILMKKYIIDPIIKIGSTVAIYEKGNLDVSIEIKSNDELGDLAQKITRMIRGLKERNQLMLDNKIFETRIKEDKKYLDNIQEGLLLLNRDLSISNQYSRFLTVLFGQKDIAGKNFLDLVYPNSLMQAKSRNELNEFILMVFNNTSSEIEMIMKVNPLMDKTLIVGSENREIVVDAYFQRIMERDKVENVMIIFEDRTHIVKVEKELEEEKKRSESEIQHIASILRAGPESFINFIQEVKTILTEIEVNLDRLQDKNIVNKLFRQMHSLKGTARYMEFKVIENVAHEIESHLSFIRDNKTADYSQSVLHIRELIKKLFEEIDSIQKLNEKFKSFSKATENFDGNIEYSKSSLINFFETLKRMTADIAGELKKKAVLNIENKLDNFPQLNLFKNSIIHLIRNAIDHGIEDKFERLSMNKPEIGQINLRLYSDEKNSKTILELEDDGAGIDFAMIKKKAIEKKLIPDNGIEPGVSQLLNIIFSPNFSSRDEVSSISGRGVGLDIIKEAVKAVHGTVTISTRKKAGTKITIKIPM